MHLNCHTGFSFKYGALRVDELFDEAVRCGVHKLVMTEINNTTSYIEMLRLCQERSPAHGPLTPTGKRTHALEIAVGVEFRRGNEFLYIAIAKNNPGFQEINRFLSYHNRENKPLPDRAPDFDNVFVIYAFQRFEPEQLRAHEFIGIRKHELNQLALYTPYAEHASRFVVWHPVTFACKKDFNTHRLLRAIANNTLLSKLPEHHQARPDEIMEPAEALAHHFEQYPDIVKNTEALLAQCRFDIALKQDKNIKQVTGSAEEDWRTLEAETWKGFAWRYGAYDNPEELKKRVNHELQVIRRKNFCAYYLVTYRLIAFAKQKGFDFVGRGSGANSVVAYCLGITNVDPIDLNLYFERFLNEERSSPPDFDIDFSWDNRDDIYQYLFETYKVDHVCLLGTHTTYKYRSILRELGKVFGLPKEEIDALVDAPQRHKSRDHITELIFTYASYIVKKELPANLSIHAGGVLITDEPIYAYTATDLPPKGYPVSHFEMHNAEDLGIYKFDILSQRGLGKLKETVKHVKRNRGIEVDIYRFQMFKDDPKVKALLRTSKAMGCFYVESPAMRMLLEKLRCEDYLTLVAASSIIRPGVASSGMMRTYIERFHLTQNGGTYASIHPKMDELMAETFGVMVYQEDVIKVAHEFAGLTLTEADVLRRGMSGKYRSREAFQQVRDRFFENCAQRGYAREVTDRVWFEIESFSGYSFAKGHSASYAVESYQSLYLKAHHPLEFMVGVINNFGGFYRTEFYFHEARMNGAIIEAPCVNRSEYMTTIYDTSIFIGFVHLKSLEERVAKEIVAERACHGEFKSLDNFLRRITLGLEQVRILIRLGSFRFTGKSKQRLLWEAMLYFGDAKQRNKTTVDLFDTEPKDYPLPALQRNPLEDAFDEIELLGFPLCNPFLLVASPERGDTWARDLKNKKDHMVHIVGYVVTTKDASTMKTKESMYFGTFYDEHGEVFDTVHFPESARKFPFRGRGFYSIKGKVTEDFGVYVVEVAWMDKLPIVNKRAEEFMRESFITDGNSNSYSRTN